MLFWRSVGWLGAAVAVSGMVFGLQMGSFLWFQSLIGRFPYFQVCHKVDTKHSNEWLSSVPRPLNDGAVLVMGRAMILCRQA